MRPDRRLTLDDLYFISSGIKKKETWFEGFAEVWTPVAFARELSTRPLGLRVAGTDIVLFRDAARRVCALVDRCPHRSVKLSLGRIEDGCLRCPFHGWRFNGDGACVEVPWHPDAQLDRQKAIPLAARELGGLVWIYTQPGVVPDSEPAPPAEVLRDDVRLYGNAFTWRAHWTRAVENMVDDSHLPFVHPRTIGRGIKSTAPARMVLDIEHHPWGYAWHVVIDGKRADWAAELRFPNVSLLRIPVPGKLLGICFAAVPVDEGQVRVLQLGYRNFLRPRLFDPIFRAINRRVIVEDQAVVESSPPGPVPPPAEERSVPTDAIGLRFRKRVYDELLPVKRPGPVSLPVVG